MPAIRIIPTPIVISRCGLVRQNVVGNASSHRIGIEDEVGEGVAEGCQAPETAHKPSAMSQAS